MIRYPPFVFKALYWYLSKLDKHDVLITMNYGYANNGNAIKLAAGDESNRYPLQLYHYMAEMTEINGKDLVEIGSGRGGGLAYIARTFSPASARGIDRENESVKFSNRLFQAKNLCYIKGDALSLPIPDESCDVILNIESSHLYSCMKTFLLEAKRVLKPGGHLLYTDFRFDHVWPEVLRYINDSGLEIVSEKDITSNILESLDLDSGRRIDLVNKYIPRLLRKELINFTGSRGSQTYNLFFKNKFTYKSFKLRKP